MNDEKWRSPSSCRSSTRGRGSLRRQSTRCATCRNNRQRDHGLGRLGRLHPCVSEIVRGYSEGHKWSTTR
eukprot:9493680-Heterocapsa_arctica.AAC.1